MSVGLPGRCVSMPRDAKNARRTTELTRYKERCNELEKTIQEGKEHFQVLFHSAPNPMSVVSLNDKKVIDVNDAFIRMSGFEREELVGHGLDELGLLAGSQESAVLVQQLTQEEKMPNVELTAFRKDGTAFPILLSAIRIGVNDQPCMLTTGIDITTQKTESENLKKSEAKYRALVENSLQGLAILQDGSLVFCNRVFAEMAGYTVEELLSASEENEWTIISPEDRQTLKNRYADRLANKPVPSRYEYRGIRKDGTEFWAETVVTVIDFNNKPAVQLACVDTTERKRAEAAAREAGERLNLALEAAGMNCWDLNHQTEEVKDEERFMQSLGYSAGEVRPNLQGWNELMHPDDLEEMRQAANDHLRGKTEYYNVEHRIRAKSGSWVWILDRGRLVSRDSSGNPLRTVGIHFDITEQKQAMEQSRQLANQQRTILNTISMGICHLIDRKIQWVNPAFAQQFGYAPDDLLGKHMSSFYANEEESARVQQEGYRQLVNGGIYSTEVLMKKRDGSFIWCSITGQAITKNLDEGSIWTLNDITARKQEEQELKRLRNYLANIIHSMPSVLIGVDEKGNVTQWNRHTESQTGLAANSVMGQQLESVFPRLADQKAEVLKAIRERTSKQITRRPYHEEGEVRYEDLTIFPLVANGVEGAVIRLDDVTEKVRMEEMMVQSEKMLSVGGLAAGLAHEINNPLGGMMQTALVLQDRLLGDLPANQNAAETCGLSLENLRAYAEARGIPKMLHTIQDSGLRAAGIVQNMLSFSRKSDSTRSASNASSLLDETIELARTDYDLKKNYDFRNIEIIRQYASDVPPVLCEPQKIQQVLLNLLRNSAQAMHEAMDQGAMRASPRIILRTAYDKGMVCIEVEDNGPGMPEEVRKRVFEPFFTTKPAGQGTGLGLSVSYFIIVENHGGQISVKSEPGKGTRFITRLPKAENRGTP